MTQPASSPLKIKVAIVDGTGPKKDYAKLFKLSFCRVLADKLQQDAHYQRGPTAAGLQTLNEAERAYAWLKAKHQEDGSARLMAAGYSRGGSAVIMAAERLKQDGIKIDSMFLFDPVARHIYQGGEVIPDNVEFSRIAQRDQSWHFVMKYEGTTSDGLGKTSNPTRPSFGQTGLNWRGFNDYQTPTKFKGTHGALGGVGWGFVPEDKPCQVEVSKWMSQQMQSRGLAVDLGPGQLDTASKPLQPGAATRALGKTVDAGLLLREKMEQLTGGWSGP